MKVLCSARVYLTLTLFLGLMMTLLVRYDVLPAMAPTSLLSPIRADKKDEPKSSSWGKGGSTTSRRWPPLTSSLASSARCPDVLHNMLRGRWHQRHMTPEEVERMRVFHKGIRQGQFHMPKGVQRADKRCGNVSVGDKGKLRCFKALCDPDGDTPCCFRHVCRNMTRQQCTCDTCEDLRAPVHAEFATWRTEDPACQPRNWTKEAVCRLLRNSTVHVIGDSLMRHLYTAFLLAATGDFETGAFRPKTSDNLRSTCSGINIFTEKVCRKHIETNPAHLCDGSVRVQFHAVYKVKPRAQQIQNVVLGLRDTPRSLVLLSIGLHDSLNAELVWERVLQPLLRTMRSRRQSNPRLLWGGVHQFGLMRSRAILESSEAAKAFNERIRRRLAAYGVPMFDTFDLTHNVTSFDGCHYGYGVNIMKVNIFLHYIEELRFQGKW